MKSGRTKEQAGSFGRAAAEYEWSRPTYPADAVDWMVPAGARVVLDLGAGTGKFTRSLLGRGLEVIAVEPIAEMRAVIEEALPEVRALEGSAESIPLPDDSVDVITVAQAWHWVDQAVALPEVARVLRPGGTLAIVWNLRDDSTPWVERLSLIMGKSEAEQTVSDGFTIGAPFGPTERFHTSWAIPIETASLVDFVASRSYVITAPPAERDATLAAVQDLIDHDPDIGGTSRVDMPYGTLAFRATTPA
ncbi:MAG: class I SAM-dependent methyltransferase [Solirubrobacteraceae bacterium]|nr:class I SAM-dependent methyltransferase [Patulibacter sp.]